MKKFTSLIVVFVFIFLFFSDLNAQEWLSTPYLDVSKENINFYDYQKAFNDWAEGKDLSEEKGIKRFKRWEWFYGPRVYPTGEMPDPAIYWNESKEHRKGNELKGANWVNLSPGSIPTLSDTSNIIGMGRINCITFHPTDPNTLWIGSSSGGVWKSVDDGQTWTCLTDMIPVLRVSDVAVDPNNTDVLYIATGDINTIQLGGESNQGLGVLKSTDGGVTWNTTGLSYVLTQGNNTLIRKILINPANSDELMAAGVDGIFKSYDAGNTWTNVDNNMIVDVKVNPLDSNVIYAASFYKLTASNSKRIFKSYDFGDTWTELNTGMPSGTTIQRVELAIAPSDTNYIYAITCGVNNGTYAIYKSTDAGQSWFVVGAVDTTGHAGAAEIPNLLGWGDGGMSGFMPDDGGQGTYDLTLVVDPNDRDKVYSGGVNMWGTDDGGATWNIVSMWVNMFGASVHADHHYSVFHPLTGELYQAHDGGIDKTDNVIIGDMNYVFTNCLNYVAIMAGDYDNAIIAGCYSLPTAWTNITSGLHITEYYRLGGCKTNAGVVVAGSQDNGTFKYNNGTWLHTLGGDGMEAMVDHNNDQIIYATNYNGALSKSIDGGYTYTSGLEQPITDAGESGAWVTPFMMHSTDPNKIYAGFYNVWKTENGANTWTQISNFTGTETAVHIAVAPSEPDSTIICVKGVNIYRTTDGGSLWTNIKTGLPYLYVNMTYAAIESNNPDRAWVTFSGYQDGEKVYVTNDGGTTWTNISEGLPNVPVNCVVHEANSNNTGAIYVGTDIGVYYTNDSIQATATKWVDYNDNLPNVVVSELEIHESAEKIRAATYGRGLWEGDLYTYNVGIKDVDMRDDFVKLYPNPVNDELNISMQLEKEEHIGITVFTLDGKKMQSIFEKAEGEYLRSLDMDKFPNGTYIIQVKVGNGYHTTKVIKE